MRSFAAIQALLAHHERQLATIAERWQEARQQGRVLSALEVETLDADQQTLQIERDTLAWLLGLRAEPAYPATLEARQPGTPAPAMSSQTPGSLTPLELKALALCLRYLQAEVREWSNDEVSMVPPLTRQELAELRTLVYAEDAEEVSLSSLYQYLLDRIGLEVPEIR